MDESYALKTQYHIGTETRTPAPVTFFNSCDCAQVFYGSGFSDDDWYEAEDIMGHPCTKFRSHPAMLSFRIVLDRFFRKDYMPGKKALITNRGSLVLSGPVTEVRIGIERAEYLSPYPFFIVPTGDVEILTRAAYKTRPWCLVCLWQNISLHFLSTDERDYLTSVLGLNGLYRGIGLLYGIMTSDMFHTIHTHIKPSDTLFSELQEWGTTGGKSI